MKAITVSLGFTLACLVSGSALAADLNLPVGGRVTIELLTSDAAFHNTMSIVSPSVAVASTGCKLETSPNLTGVKIVSEKNSVHGCRVTLDSDPVTAGIQGFAAGATLRFNLCAQENADPACEHIWSSNAASNSDGIDHVHTTSLRPAQFPNQIFQLSWEDQDGGGDNDFNDLVAVVRVDMDTDGDGLWDDWEQFGADVDGNGTVDLDLPAMGANPNHRDVFVEIDWMDCTVAGSDCAAGDTHNHRPKAAAVTAAINAFAGANVNNPDGTTGINLHIDVNNSISHQNALNINGLCFAGGTGIGSFDTVKAAPANFGPNNPRRFSHHYSLFTHRQIATSTSSGCGELPGNDFQVALGGWNVGLGDADGDGTVDDNVGTIQQQSGTIIHELGHNLGLQHGGGDGNNFKPNYIGAMNYFFQTGGIPPTDPDGPAGPLVGRLDYSRTVLNTLNELSLSEPAGVGAGTDNSFFFCPNFSRNNVTGNNAANWNCNTPNTDTGVVADINGDRVCITAGNDGVLNSAASGDDAIQANAVVDGPNRTCNSATTGDDQLVRPSGGVQPTSLVGFTDWTNIGYALQSTGSFEDGNHDDSLRTIEVDYPTFLDVLTADLALTMTAAPPLVSTGSNVTFSLTIKNLQPGAARQVELSDILPTGTTFVSCASTLGGVCSGSGNNRTVTFDLIPGGESAVVTLVANVTCANPNGLTMTNTGLVASPDDFNAANNGASVSAVALNPPPTIGPVSVSSPTLLTPNHKFVVETVAYTATDNCGPIVCGLAVSSNEPINGLGDGDTAPDWSVIDDHRLNLRSERSGTGPGRIYTIGVTCSDSASNSSSKSVQVKVPH